MAEAADRAAMVSLAESVQNSVGPGVSDEEWARATPRDAWRSARLRLRRAFQADGSLVASTSVQLA